MLNLVLQPRNQPRNSKAKNPSQETEIHNLTQEPKPSNQPTNQPEISAHNFSPSILTLEHNHFSFVSYVTCSLTTSLIIQKP